MDSRGLPVVISRIAPALRRSRPRLRIPLGVGAMISILYFMLAGLFVIPRDLPPTYIRTDGQAAVYLTSNSGIYTSALLAAGVRSDDVLLAVDSVPFRQSGLRFAFDPSVESHRYLFQRDGLPFVARNLPETPFRRGTVDFLALLIIILEMGGLGLVILLFSPPDDDLAWKTGAVWLGLALVSSAWWNPEVPGAVLAFNTMSPFLCVGFLEMTLFSSGRKEKTGRRVIRILNGGAILLALAAAAEVFILRPAIGWNSTAAVLPFDPLGLAGGLREAVTDLMEIALAMAALGLIVQRLRARSIRIRRRLNLLIVAFALAAFPLLLYSLEAITGMYTGLWLLILPLFGVLPAAYGYLILRHRYLRLDLFASRFLQNSLAAVAASLLYLGVAEILRANPLLGPLQPLLGMLLLLGFFALLAHVGNPLQHGMEVLLYGSGRTLQNAADRLSVRLTADPQTETLKDELLHALPELLQVRQAALLLMDSSGRFSPAGKRRLARDPEITAAETGRWPALLLRQTAPDDPFFRREGWAHAAAPLRIRGQIIGVWILGAKLPDGSFDAQEADVIRQAAGAAAIALENARLFEALQDLAQERLRVRQAERQELAARLHDDPLQRAASVAGEIDRMVARDGGLTPEQAVLLRRQIQEVRRLAGELRDICAGLRPVILDQGLCLTLREVVETFRRREPGIEVSLSLPEESDPPLSSEAMDSIYHVVTEALTNAGKHARASRIRVEVSLDEGTVRVAIEDDGAGMPAGGYSLPDLLRGRHFGLAGMHQWAALAGGRLVIGAAEPHGTRVTLELLKEGLPAR